MADQQVVIPSLVERNMVFWGISQVSKPSYCAAQDYFNKLADRRLGNVKISYNKWYVFKLPGFIEELDEDIS